MLPRSQILKNSKMQNTNNATKHGVIFALLAYGIWGLVPIYFKAMSYIRPMEMVSHRVVWSFILLLILIAAQKNFGKLKVLILQPKKIFWLFISSVLIATNWLVFIWAAAENRLLEASLGYYINPLINVILGLFFLQERLARMQWIAVIVAGIGVFIQLIHFGSVPWVALALGGTFGFYGLIRKKVKVESIAGLWVETTLLLPFAATYLLYFAPNIAAPLAHYSGATLIALIASGFITSVPLLCFAAAAARLPLSQLGFFQYIGPSCMFLLATFYYNEPLTSDKLVTFIFIWSALILFIWHGCISYRKNHKPEAKKCKN